MSSGSQQPSSPRELVARYLERMVAHDFDPMAECLAEDVVRVGPFGDTYTGKQVYVAFLSQLMPALEGYSMRVDRIFEVGGTQGARQVAVAELTETVEIDGKSIETPEALVFDFDDGGLIAHIAIYIQRLT